MAASMSRTTYPIWRSGPNRRLIDDLPLRCPTPMHAPPPRRDVAAGRPAPGTRGRRQPVPVSSSAGLPAALPKQLPPTLPAQVRACVVAADSPDVFHLRVGGSEGDARFEDEQDARTEQQKNTNGAQEKGHPTGIELGKADNAEGDTRRQKRAETEVKLRQCLLAEPGPNRGPTEIVEEHRHLRLVRLLGTRERLEQIGRASCRGRGGDTEGSVV